MSDTLAQPASNTLIEAAISKIGDIATLPEITIKIIQIVEDPKSTARDLHEIIRNDPALSAKILKVVNSAFYGLPGQITSVDRAIVLLGLSAIKNISVAMSMTRMFKGGTAEGVDGVQVWRHSLAVAAGCRMLSKMQGHPALEEGFLAGLLHDLGLLIERQALPSKLAEVVRRYEAAPKPFCVVEQEVIGADHQAFGMAMAARWRFPRSLRTAIGYHHQPLSLAPENRDLAMLVQVADIMACRAQIGFCYTAANEQIDEQVLASIPLTNEDVESMAGQLPEQVAILESLFQP